MPRTQLLQTTLLIRIILVLYILGTSAPAALWAEDEEARFVIHQVYLLIDGNTMPGALRSFLTIKDGTTFSSWENMIETLEAEKKQLTERKYYSSVDYIIEGNQQSGYIVTFMVKEEMPYIPTILPDFDRRSRRRQGYEGMYDNAFGTMTDWDVSMYAKLNSSGVGDWQISQSMRKMRIGGRIYAVHVSQTHDQIFFEEFGKVLGNYSVDVTRASISTEFELDNSLIYEMEPGVTLRYNYADYGGVQAYTQTPFEITYDQCISREYFDWIANGREGTNHRIYSSFGFAQPLDNILLWEYRFLVGSSFSMYWLPWKYMSVYSNITADYSFFTNLPMKGYIMRGITDERLYGNKGLYLRNTLGFDLLRVPDTVNFHLHPFLDLGTASSAGNFFHTLYAGTGIDVILFLDFASDFVLRASVGWDLTELIKEQQFRLELTLQTGLAY